MFENKMKENQENLIEINDIDDNIFEALFKLIYLGEIQDIKDICDDLFIAADKYQIQDLKYLCQSIMIKKISIKN